MARLSDRDLSESAKAFYVGSILSRECVPMSLVFCCLFFDMVIALIRTEIIVEL